MKQTGNLSQQVKDHPLVQLVIARLREFWREPAAVFWVYGFPLIMMISLGVAFRHRPVESIQVDLVKSDRMEAFHDYLENGENTHQDLMELSGIEIHDEETSQLRLRTGKTALVVAHVESEGFVFSYDPTRPGSILVRNTLYDRIQRWSGREDKVTVSDDPVSETGGRYIDFLVPGLLGMGLMGGGMWGVGFSIVNLRIRKLLKRYLATPMKRSHFLIAMMISRVLFTIPEMLVLVWGAHWLFGVENQGSFLAVVVLVFLGAFEFSGIGLLIASRAETTETVSGLMNLVMLPMWIGSGVFYSVDRFPASVQLVLNQLPLTPLIHGLRGVMQDGASLAVLFPQLMVISLWGLITFGLALWWFRWQ